MKICPNCKMQLEEDAGFCTECGCNLAQFAITTQLASPHCEKCGTSLRQGARFCPSCGNVIPTSNSGQNQVSAQFVQTPFIANPAQSMNTGMKNASMLETLKEMFLSQEGRLNRKPFFLRGLAAVAAGFVAQIIILTIMGLPFGLRLGQFAQIAFWFPQYCLMVRRLHDIGQNDTLAKVASALWIGGIMLGSSGSVLLLAESAIGLYLLVKEGDRGANAYGADPLEGQH